MISVYVSMDYHKIVQVYIMVTQHQQGSNIISIIVQSEAAR